MRWFTGTSLSFQQWCLDSFGPPLYSPLCDRVLVPLGVKYPRCFSTKLSHYVLKDKDEEWHPKKLRSSLRTGGQKGGIVLKDRLIITHVCIDRHWVLVGIVNPAITELHNGEDAFRGFVLIDSWGSHDSWEGTYTICQQIIPRFRKWLMAQDSEDLFDFTHKRFPTVIPKTGEPHSNSDRLLLLCETATSNHRNSPTAGKNRLWTLFDSKCG